MKLSTRTQYGLRMLCQLAAEYNNGPMQLGEIVSREGISEKYLGQIMLILRASGLVLAVRGSQGGYYLARPPHAIRVREAFEILEGELLGAGDEAKPGQEPQSSGMLAASNEVWTRLRIAMAGVLDSYTLADLVGIRLQKQGMNEYSI